MKCDKCDSMIVNGVFCHEFGCENSNKRYNKEDDIWEQLYFCDGCGADVLEDETCCD
jgi:3-oxoacyl-[acyl-carrier-protein] synthase III